MSTTTINHAGSTSPADREPPKRLIVHVSGDKAGLMQVETELPPQLREDAADSDDVELVIPGETSPVKPLDITKADAAGRQVVSFFSSDIANAGHLPAAATLSFKMPDGSVLSTDLSCVSAEAAENQTVGESAAAVDTYPIDKYPRTVGVVALISLAVGLLIMTMMLLSL